ncbi:MAG: penicillin-binding protein activator LpoB [Deltaproteobacteria bacterium HGW-Deltaproteobacteria-6]|nr:MAG: penicillin-binding protein activator LpoB [Deltaproteobacteria bacterium HGW-Deltaproteobacteria-6]
MKTRMIGMLLIVITSFMISGCATTIQHGIADKETVTGSDWSARDLKEVADHMVNSITRRANAPGSELREGKPRWILARDLRNETDEHVNTRTIMEKVRTKLINDGIARFVDDQALNDIMNQLKFQQSGLFDNKTVVQVGKLVGAKYILRGAISSIRKRSDRIDIIYYNITLQLVNIQTGEIVWTDEKEIQRLTEKSLFR